MSVSFFLKKFATNVLAKDGTVTGADVYLAEDCDRAISTLRAQLTETQRLLEVQLAVGGKLQDAYAKMAKDMAELQHDIKRHIAIASREADARVKAEAELAALRELCAAVFQSDDMHQALRELRDALGRLDASPSALAQNSHPVANMSADSEAPTE